MSCVGFEVFKVLNFNTVLCLLITIFVKNNWLLYLCLCKLRIYLHTVPVCRFIRDERDIVSSVMTVLTYFTHYFNHLFSVHYTLRNFHNKSFILTNNKLTKIVSPFEMIINTILYLECTRSYWDVTTSFNWKLMKKIVNAIDFCGDLFRKLKRLTFYENLISQIKD